MGRQDTCGEIRLGNKIHAAGMLEAPGQILRILNERNGARLDNAAAIPARRGGGGGREGAASAYHAPEFDVVEPTDVELVGQGVVANEVVESYKLALSHGASCGSSLRKTEQGKIEGKKICRSRSFCAHSKRYLRFCKKKEKNPNRRGKRMARGEAALRSLKYALTSHPDL